MIKNKKLPFSFDVERLRSDLARFADDEWTPHFNTFNYEGDWSTITLRGAVGAVLEAYPDPTATSYSDTERMRRCDYIPEVAAALGCELETVRLMKLGPGDRITEHRDYMTSIETGCARIHVPIETSAEVEFVVDDERIEMNPGEAWYVNFNLKHKVDNRGMSRRVHLVLDCVPNDHLRALVGV